MIHSEHRGPARLRRALVVIADGPWNVGVMATGGLSHFPELSMARVGTSDVEFDRRLIGWMEHGDSKSLGEMGRIDLAAVEWPLA